MRVHGDPGLLVESRIGALEESNGNGSGMVLGRNLARQRAALTLTWHLLWRGARVGWGWMELSMMEQSATTWDGSGGLDLALTRRFPLVVKPKVPLLVHGGGQPFRQHSTCSLDFRAHQLEFLSWDQTH